LRLFNRNFPSSGGGYFRLLPYALSRWMLRRVNAREGQAAVFYFHPWEIDADQPRVEGIDPKTRFRHYLNLDRMEGRLQQLLRDFRWARMDRLFLAPGSVH
jgi:polysaccharide deacetylase family protein (PEP-CTERM system associated)